MPQKTILSFVVRFAVLLALLSGVFVTSPAAAASKLKTKKESTHASASEVTRKLNMEGMPSDPVVTEPSEAILAIKNRAERTYWQGRKTLNQQQQEHDAGQSGAKNDALRRASTSDLLGIAFDDQPLRMADSATFQQSLDRVAFELGRPCKDYEYLGWPLGATEQARVDRIFADSMARLKVRGFTINPHSPRAAAKDVSVFTADRRAVPVGRHAIGLWSAGDAGLLLLVCETETPKTMAAPLKEKAKANKKKSRNYKNDKKSSSKKARAANKKSRSYQKQQKTQKPKVIPGGVRSDIKPPAEPSAEFKKPVEALAAPAQKEADLPIAAPVAPPVATPVAVPEKVEPVQTDPPRASPCTGAGPKLRCARPNAR